MIELTYPAVLMISEKKYRQLMAEILESGTQEVVSSAPLSAINQISLLVNPQMPENYTFLRVRKQWIRIENPEIEAPMPESQLVMEDVVIDPPKL